MATIDERLDALTHTVELLAGMQIKTEKQVKRLGKYIHTIATMVLDHETRVRSLEGDEDEEENGKENN